MINTYVTYLSKLKINFPHGTSLLLSEKINRRLELSEMMLIQKQKRAIRDFPTCASPIQQTVFEIKENKISEIGHDDWMTGYFGVNKHILRTGQGFRMRVSTKLIE